MGLFTSMFGGKPKLTKEKIMGLTASNLDFVISQQGIHSLLAGSIVLDKNLNSSFSSGKPRVDGHVIAVCAIAELEEAEIFQKVKDLIDSGKKTEDEMMKMMAPLLSSTVDQIVFAASRTFIAECPEFASLATA